MRHGWLCSTLVCCALALVSPHCDAQRAMPGGAERAAIPRYRLRIIGVYDMQTGAPIEGVDVIDVLSGNVVRTTNTGTASLLFLPDGGGLVRIRKIGYQIQTLMVSISPSDTAPITLVMDRMTDLPAVVTIDTAPHYISPGLRGFQERLRVHAAGTFIDEKQLRKEDGRLLGTMLSLHVPNLAGMIRYGRQGKVLLPAECAGGIFLDGVPLAPQSAPPPRMTPRAAAGAPQVRSSGLTPGPVDLSEFSIENLGAVEYYRPLVAPPQYETGNGCGTLLLWSRER